MSENRYFQIRRISELQNRRLILDVAVAKDRSYLVYLLTTRKPRMETRRRMHLSMHPHDASASSSSLASFRSSVSKPSVNHPETGARRASASSRLPWSAHSHARLVAARSSQDFARCGHSAAWRRAIRSSAIAMLSAWPPNFRSTATFFFAASSDSGN